MNQGTIECIFFKATLYSQLQLFQASAYHAANEVGVPPGESYAPFDHSEHEEGKSCTCHVSQVTSDLSGLPAAPRIQPVGFPARPASKQSSPRG